jgi:hypothetical protein
VLTARIFQGKTVILLKQLALKRGLTLFSATRGLLELGTEFVIGAGQRKNSFFSSQKKFGHKLSSIRKDHQSKELLTREVAYNLNILIRRKI